MKIKRVFVANRGEIALRVMRTCRRLGIETVLGASEADIDSVPARFAERVICIGPPRARDSYLRDETIVHAALGVGADAIHPGYGFRPTPGTVDTAHFPEGDGIRVDTHIVSGIRVSPYYDSLMAKLIAHGSDRGDAVMRMKDALARCRITGVSSNIELHSLLMNSAAFAEGDVDTSFLPAFLEGRLGHVQD